MGNGKKSVISGKSLKAMRVPQADAGARGQMGITWFIRQVGEVTAYAHGGATNGQQAYFFFIPDQDFACAILTNSDDGGIITAEVFTKVMELYFNAKAETPRPMEVGNQGTKGIYWTLSNWHGMF